jgi:hypothetical protein
MFSMYSGYGNLAPKTGPGKVVTIIYALIGKTKHFHCAIVRHCVCCVCVCIKVHSISQRPFQLQISFRVNLHMQFRDINQTATTI